MSTPRSSTTTRRKLSRFSVGLVAASALLLAACGSDDDAATTAAETTTTAAATTAAPTTTAAATTAAPTTAVEVVPDDDTEAESSAASFNPDATALTAEFKFVDPGVYLVDTIGTPFSFEVTDPLFVQPNSDSWFVLSDPNAQGPDDRDLVFYRVSDLSDPLQPAAALDDQELWPATDIEGWLDAVGDNVLISNRSETTVGGRAAVQFDMQLPDVTECNEEDAFCVGFVTNRGVNGKSLEPLSSYRVWWIDEGEESPIALVAGIQNESDLDWFETTESMLETLAFGDTAPNPIAAEGDLWTLGFSAEVPAGVVEVAATGGLRFELAEERFVIQGPSNFLFGLSSSAPDQLPEAGSEILLIDELVSGGPIVTADDAIEGLIALEVEVTDVETTTVAGFPTRVVDVSGETEGVFVVAGEDSGPGWFSPFTGRLWFVESDRGLLLGTAYGLTPDALLEDAIAQTTTMMSTLELIEPN